MFAAGFRQTVTGYLFRHCPLCIRLSFFTAAGIATAFAPASFGRPPAAPSSVSPVSQQRFTLDEINTRVASLQSRIDSLTMVRNQIRQDSSRIVAESSLRGSILIKKRADLDETIAKKKSVLEKTSAQYERSKQDSAAIVAKGRDQIANLQKEIIRLNTQAVTLSNDLAAISARLEKPETGGGDSRTIAQLQEQAARSDSIIRARQAELSDLNARRERIRQDSAQADAKLGSERARFHAQVRQFDSLAALCDAAAGQTEQSLARDRAEKEQKIAQVKAGVASMEQQKKMTAERITRMNTDISACSAERQQLAKSAGTAVSRYEQLRAPYDKAFADAEDNLQRLSRDKPIILVMRQKLRVDSAIAKTRDLLDKAIQMNAENKRGAGKLVIKYEDDLNVLFARQDSIARSIPGLRQKEAQMRSATMLQKAIMLDTAIAGIDKKIVLAQMQREKARQSLAAFDQKNPAVKNPSGQRIADLDAMMTSKKKEVIQMMDWTDSVNMQIQESQNSLNQLSAAARAGSPKSDSVLRSKKDEKKSLLDRRAKIQRDSAQNDAAAMATVNRIRNDCAGFTAQSAKIQGDIDRTAAERDKTRQSIAALQDKGRQMQAAALQEKKKNESLADAKQQEIFNIAAQTDKLRQDSASIVKKTEQQVKNLSPPPAVLATVLFDENRELNAFQAQSDSLKRLTAADQGRINDAARRVSMQIAAVIKQIENTQEEIAPLNAQKKNALARLSDDKRYYDNVLADAEKELASMTARRDKLRQDSAAAENNIRKTLQKLSSGLAERDYAVAARQKEVADAAAEYNRARDDSSRAAQKISAALQPYIQSIKSIDVMIALREKDISDLNLRLEKASLDNTAGNRRRNDRLAAAHAEIEKRNAVVEQKKNELALAIAVKGDAQKDMDPAQRSYREALATATMEIQIQNAGIEKKKKEIARLKNVRDAMIAASTGDVDSRLDEDKRHYDSLLNIAEMDLAEMGSRRDLARQDSAASQDIVRQFAQKTSSRVAEREKMIIDLQKEVADAVAAYNRARNDSIKILTEAPANATPSSEQMVKTINTMIEVKAQELGDLQNRRDKASQDSLNESKRQADLFATVRKDIARQAVVLEQKKKELAAATAAKKDTQKDTASAVSGYRDILATAVLELQAQNGLIDNKKAEMGRTQKVRDALNSQIQSAEKAPGRAAATPAEIAQKRAEVIYLLLGDNRLDEATALYKQYQQFLKTNLDKDNFEAIKITIEQMGGSTQ